MINLLLHAIPGLREYNLKSTGKVNQRPRRFSFHQPNLFLHYSIKDCPFGKPWQYPLNGIYSAKEDVRVKKKRESLTVVYVYVDKRRGLDFSTT